MVYCQPATRQSGIAAREACQAYPGRLRKTGFSIMIVAKRAKISEVAYDPVKCRATQFKDLLHMLAGAWRVPFANVCGAR